MRDLRSALAIARKNVEKTRGNSGYSGNSSRNVSYNNNLDQSEPVSSAATRVATVDTDSVDVATVATAFHAVDTPAGISKRESKQSLREAVATVSTVATENRDVQEISAPVSRWRAGMRSFESSSPPCPGFGPDKWLRVRQAAQQFLEEFGQQSAALGWGDLDLFGVHPEVGILRGDCSGGLMLSKGRRIVAVSEHTMAYEDKLTFYRKPDRERGPSVVIWEFRGGPHG